MTPLRYVLSTLWAILLCGAGLHRYSPARRYGRIVTVCARCGRIAHPAS